MTPNVDDAMKWKSERDEARAELERVKAQRAEFRGARRSLYEPARLQRCAHCGGSGYTNR
jgi:hypothetical protein